MLGKAWALPHRAVSCPEQAFSFSLLQKKRWYTRAQKKIFFVCLFIQTRDTQQTDTPVACSVAFSVTQEGTRIHIHLWDPWACVSVSTELHWVLRCKSNSCFQKGLCRSTRDLSLLGLLIFNPLSCSVPLHWIHRRNDRTDTGCMRKAAHGLQTFSLYLSHSFLYLCLFVYPWSFLSTLCLYTVNIYWTTYVCLCIESTLLSYLVIF